MTIVYIIFPDMAINVKGKVLYRKLGEKIYTARRKRHMTQDQLAERTGIDRTYISQVENGRRNPSLTVAAKISKTLKIQLDDLIEEMD